MSTFVRDGLNTSNEHCLGCGKHIRQHYGGTEYRCEPRAAPASTMTTDDLAEAITTARVVVEDLALLEQGESISTDFATWMFRARDMASALLHLSATRDAERALIDAAIAWRETPFDDHGSSSAWVGALTRMERAIDALCAAKDHHDR